MSIDRNSKRGGSSRPANKIKAQWLSVSAGIGLAGLLGALALGQTIPVSFTGFTPGNLVVTRSVYGGSAATVAIGQPLPPICPATAACGGVVAVANGAFPAVGSANNVWNNDTVDGSFGVTSPVFLDQITPTGAAVNTYAVPANLVTTSFSSKSELALNLTADGSAVTFMAYAAPPNAVDVSNANTPGVYDPTNPAGGSYYRVVAQVSANGSIQVTNTNTYSGNNGRAAVLANGYYYMVGNANNGGGTPANVVASAGVQIATPGQPQSTLPTEVGSFSISQITNPATGQPYAADKLGKDNNFRGLTLFNNTLYITKGSGSNGIDTVYQVGAAGNLPAMANAAATPITVLPGFPVSLAKTAGKNDIYPFGIWFANATTLYVADEGDGVVADAATAPNAGLQKWSLVNGKWQMDYVLQNGLQLGVPYTVANYPTALNPSTDGLRNITGVVNGDGTVTIWGITSTVSANGDQGADPNKLVSITDVLTNTAAAGAAKEAFTTIKSANYGEVLRGVSFTPGTGAVNTSLSITTASPLSSGAVGDAYSVTLTATGGAAPYSWKLASGSALPAGLALSTAGAITGTPTAASTSTFTIQVSDSASTTVTKTFSLAVSNVCGYSVSVAGQGFPAAGGTGAIGLTANSGCPWTVANLPSWVTLTGSATGTGNASIAYTVAANTGLARTSNVTVSGLPFTIEQVSAFLTGFNPIGSLAQVSSGGYWKTTLNLVNTGGGLAQVRVNFFDLNGNPATLPLSFPQTGASGQEWSATLDRTLNPGAELVIDTTGPDGQPTQVAWAQLLSNGSVTGTAVFRQLIGTVDQEAQAAFETRTPNAFVLPYDNTSGMATGVSVANNSAQAASVTVVVRNDGGTVMFSNVLAIPADGQASFDLSTAYPAAKLGRGTVEFDVPAGGSISVVGLRYSPLGAFSAVPALVK